MPPQRLLSSALHCEKPGLTAHSDWYLAGSPNICLWCFCFLVLLQMCFLFLHQFAGLVQFYPGIKCCQILWSCSISIEKRDFQIPDFPDVRFPLRRNVTTCSAWTSPRAPRSSRASSSSSSTTSLFSSRSTWQAPLLTTRRSTRSDLCAPTSERWSPQTPPSVTRG